MCGLALFPLLMFLIPVFSKCFISFFPCTYRISPHKGGDDQRPKSLKSNVFKVGRPPVEQSFNLQWLDSLRWHDGTQVQSDISQVA